MSDDFSVLRLDVDESAVRALLDALGVELPEAERRGRDAEDESSGESPLSRERTGPRVGETPPPGAGDEATLSRDDDTEESGGWDRRYLAAAGAAVLAVVAGVAAVLYRRRSGDELPVPDVDLPGVPADVDLPGVPGDVELPGLSSDGGAPTEDVTDGVPTDEAPDGDDRPETTIDATPLIGIALLAVGTAVVRAVQSERD